MQDAGASRSTRRNRSRTPRERVSPCTRSRQRVSPCARPRERAVTLCGPDSACHFVCGLGGSVRPPDRVPRSGQRRDAGTLDLVPLTAHPCGRVGPLLRRRERAGGARSGLSHAGISCGNRPASDPVFAPAAAHCLFCPFTAGVSTRKGGFDPEHKTALCVPGPMPRPELCGRQADREKVRLRSTVHLQCAPAPRRSCPARTETLCDPGAPRSQP
ncbi:uncharacterized protein LOC106007379 [Mustela putorius furo]|uniref:Uncharacterized protein LOC106007379 n=1 Tax=Mustela putorius furo TaxID=9669 RepID=A0A8U0SLZ9_MUSPF|nr:uncharacterized protein LOC106007379 [Mustela putorius furo]